MTVIVAALTKDQGIVMAADRLASNGWQKQYHLTPKLWVAEGFAMGAAGTMRVGQVLKHHVTWPKYRPDEDTDLEAFLVKTVVPAIRAGAKDHGVIKTTEGLVELDAQLLLATGDHLAKINTDGCVMMDSSNRMAVGSGYAEALGRLGEDGPWTEADVIDAVRRAIRQAVGCDGPISVVDTRTLTIRTLDTKTEET